MRPDVIAGRPARYTASQVVHGLCIAAVSGALVWIVSIYASALRDPHYLDGWLLAGGMALQLYFHYAIKTGGLQPKSAMRWRKVHVFVGYLLIALFLSHSDFSLPDTSLEWALWIAFVLVTLSGIFSAYLAWSLRTKGRIEDGIAFDRIPARRAELAADLDAAIAVTNPAADAIALPGLPYDAWINDLYVTHLRGFFQGPRNFAAHLIGSHQPLKRIMTEIDGLSRYVDQEGKSKLSAVKSLVIEKDRLDFARVHLGLTRAWLYVHVPATYALLVLTVLHVLVAYSYSSGTR